jgi:NAD-dependent deacetylase
VKRIKVFVLSGAGIDKESGVKTFRDSGEGLWHHFKVEDIATIYAWSWNKENMIDFYNWRRREMDGVVPNQAHKILAELESDFDVTIATQNVSDLHEKAGSTNVIHLHGELSKLRSEYNCDTIIPYDHDLQLGEVCPEGGQYRPDIVLFGENLDFMRTHNTKVAAQEADVCIIVGTSMAVSPANTIPWETKDSCLIYYVDPGEVEFNIPKQKRPFFYHIKKVATEGMEEVKKDLIEIFK